MVQQLDAPQVDGHGNPTAANTLGTVTIVQGYSGNFSVFCALEPGDGTCLSTYYNWYTGNTSFTTSFNPTQTYASGVTTLKITVPTTLLPGNYMIPVTFVSVSGVLTATRNVAVVVQANTGITTAQRTSILNLAQSWKASAHYDGNFGAPCVDACVVTIEYLVNTAIGKFIGSATIYNTDILKKSGAIVQESQGAATVGDLMIVDSRNLADAHVGVCENAGCTDVISNASSSCRFTFDSPNNQRFSYSGSPYVGGTATYWRIR